MKKKIKIANTGFGNAKATMDNGHRMLLGMLAYKLTDRWNVLVRVSGWSPYSQLCSVSTQDFAYTLKI